ncbi:hypothetical protein GIB67_028183, partial [Kingdonia uniflora]
FHKEKHSSYAPETGVRYDGIYKIEKYWRKIRISVCDEHGDCPRPLPLIKELKKATDITNRKDTPSWDYEERVVGQVVMCFSDFLWDVSTIRNPLLIVE